MAPVVWVRLAWSVPDGIGAAGWLFILAFSAAPFALLAFLRGSGLLRRVAAVLATVVAAVLVVLGQVAGMNPNDGSSTAAIALVFVPVLAALAVLAIWGFDAAVRAHQALWNRRR